MARRGFLWHLFSENKLPLYVDTDGTVKEGTADYLKPNGQPAHLMYSPKGWKDSLIKYARNIKYWGLQRDFTVPMDFPGDGFIILKKMMWTLGYTGKVYIGIHKLNRLQLPYGYEGWYFADINMVRYKQSKTSVRVEAIEGGMSKQFKAFETTEFEIPIDEDDQAVYILADGIELEIKQDYSYLQDFEWGGLGFYSVQFTNPIVRKNPDGLAPYVHLFDQFADVATIDNNFKKYLVGSENYMAYVDENAPAVPIPVNFEGRVDVKRLQQNINNGLINFRLWHVRKDDTFLTVDQEYEIFRGYIFGENDANRYTRFVDGAILPEIIFDITIPMMPGDRVFYTTEYYPLVATTRSVYTFEETCEMNVTSATRYKETYVKGLYAYRVFEKLVDKLITGAILLPTDDGLYYKSQWLKDKKDLVITSQEAIRGIEKSVMKTSIEQLFKSLGFYGTAAGVENGKLFIELFNYAFSDDILVDLGEVADADLEIAEDLLFNTIKAGGKEVEYGDVNGRYEFNQGQHWATINTVGVAELDLTTPYRRDCYGFEYARIDLTDKNTTDDKSDNDVWMINVEPGSNVALDGTIYKKLNRPAYTTLTGVPASVFNTELTPKISILNNGARIHSILDLQDMNEITLTKSDKNKELVTELIRRVAESEPISISTFSPNIFRPIYINFTTQVPVNMLALMKLKPYGKIKFTVRGRVYYAYLMDGSIKPAMNDKQVWKVLSSKENNFSKFYDLAI